MVYVQGVPKISDYQKKVLKEIECCGAKFSHGHDLGALDPVFQLNFNFDFWNPSLSLSKKRPKNNFQTQGVPTTGDCAYALWIQQHSVIKFFGTPCIYSPIDFSTCHPLETTWILTFNVPIPSTGHYSPAPLLYLIQVSVSWAEGSFDSSRACLSQWCSVILTSMCPL